MMRAKAYAVRTFTLVCGAWATLLFPVAAVEQELTFEQVGSFPGTSGIDMIRAQGNYVYVGGDKTLTIFDVSDPEAPVRRGSYTFPDQLWGFRVEGSRIYVGANFFGMGILDVSDPDAPKLAGSFESIGQTKIGAVFGTKAVLIDHMEGVVMVDISNEAEPVLMSSFYLDGYARDVVVRGSMAYAVDSPSGLYVFDLSKPGPIEPVGMFHGENAPQAIEASQVPDENGPSIVCGAAAGALQIYDVSDPSAPIHAASIATPGRVQRVRLRGARAYVAAGRGGLQIVDLSTPSEPTIIGSFETEGSARDVAVSGSLVFVLVRGANGGRVVVLREAR